MIATAYFAYTVPYVRSKELTLQESLVLLLLLPYDLPTNYCVLGGDLVCIQMSHVLFCWCHLTTNTKYTRNTYALKS